MYTIKFVNVGNVSEMSEDENHPQIFIMMGLEDIDGLFWTMYLMIQKLI